MRTTSDTSLTTISPSPGRPVWAASRIVSDDLRRELVGANGQEHLAIVILDVPFGRLIEMAECAATALPLDAQQGDTGEMLERVQCVLDAFEHVGADHGNDLLHRSLL